MTDNLPAEVPESTPNLLSVISRAAADPAVDVLKMEALLRLQREIMADAAAAEFNAAYTRLTDRIPMVKKNGTISLGQGREVAFAKWEDINAVIQPLLRAENLGLTFTTRQEGSQIVLLGKLVHSQGHSITAELTVPPDTGPGRNPLQAIGSALSYGKRYVTEMLLNIVREGQDDDGAGGPPTVRRGRAPAGFRPQQEMPAPKIVARAAEPAGKRVLDEAYDSARTGTYALRRFWEGLRNAQKRELAIALEWSIHEGCPAQLKAIARQADKADQADNEQNPADVPAAGATSRDPVEYLNA